MAIEVNLLNNNNTVGNINTNMQRIKEALQDGVSRSGSTPNQMEADLDMNSNEILNANTVDTKYLMVDGERVVPRDLVVVDIPDGSVTREKLFNFEPSILFNPIEFGAVGDGVTNDAFAYQAAEDNAYPVFLPSDSVFNLGDVAPSVGKMVKGLGKIRTFGVDLGGFDIVFDPVQTNIFSTPDIYANKRFGPTGTPGTGVNNFNNVVFAPGSNAAQDGVFVWRSEIIGSQAAEQIVEFERETIVGNQARRWGRYGNRNVAIGSLALAWAGDNDPANHFHDFWLYQSSPGVPAPPGDPDWNFDDIETLAPGTGALIASFNDWASSRDHVAGNIAVGRDAGLHLIRGTQNTWMGYRAGTNSWLTDYNTVIGNRAHHNGVFASYMTAMGYRAAYNWVNGNRNTVIGADAADDAVEGSTSIVVGSFGGNSLKTITGSMIFGYRSGEGWGTDTADNVLAFQNLHTRLPLLSGNFTAKSGGTVPVGIGVNILPADQRGTLHIRSASSGVTSFVNTADDLIIENNTSGGITIATPNGQRGIIRFAHPSNNSAALIFYDEGDDILRLNIGSSSRIAISADGLGFNGTAASPKPTGVPVTAEGIHAALVSIGLIAA